MNLLYLPVRLELLHLAEATSVAETSFDPTRLPWTGGGRDFQSDTAFLGDEVASPPFQNLNLVLQRGVYLHWQLPRQLTRSQVEPDKKVGVYPPLPNRWLVTRKMDTELRRWVVESDYLQPGWTTPLQPSTAYPIPGGGMNPAANRAFRWLGRVLLYDDWINTKPGAQSLDPLTVVGYGNPSFAAFYPDSRGVFSFYDPDPEAISRNGSVEYSVTGWYSRPEEDPLESPNGKAVWTGADIAAETRTAPSVTETGGKSANGDVGQIKPDASGKRSLVCHGKTALSSGDSKTGTPVSLLLGPKTCRRLRLAARRGQAPVQPYSTIAIGNSATEALSAFLGARLAPDKEDEQLAITAKLEAILMAADLGHRLQDQYPEFLEGRHEKGFLASDGGILWTIKPDIDTLVPANAPKDGDPEGPAIPAVCIPMLNQLNKLQRKIDHLGYRRFSPLQRLSADWHKYMLCAYPPPGGQFDYPDPDAMAYLMKSESEKELAENDQQLGAAQSDLAPLANQIGKLLSNVEPGEEQELYLAPIPGPRFWAPRDPVVVLEAPAELVRYLPGAEPEISNEETAGFLAPELPDDPKGLLPADPDSLANPPTLPSGFDWSPLAQGVDAARPIFVEWAARLFPLAEKLEGEGGAIYGESYVSSRFAPAAGGPDLVLRAPTQAPPMETFPPPIDERSYSGRSIVSAHAARILHERLEDYLVHNFDPAWPDQPVTDGKTEAEKTAARLTYLRDPANLQKAITASMPKSAAESASLSHTALVAYQIIRGMKILCLPLGGFNETLLMRRQMVQLPIADPIGFPDYQNTAKEVSDLVGDLPLTAPAPLLAFNPIRNGMLQLDRLRIIDSFGRPYDLAFDPVKIVAAETLRQPNSRQGILFPPRFIQPMRVQFRWLSAEDMEEEANSHPDTSPVCGWLLPNRLDESIAAYDSDGNALGSIDLSGIWRTVPGSEQPVVPRDIPNPHLRRVVLHILAQAADGKYQKAFLQTINTALEDIDPDSFASNPAISLLIGRPIAVVRASVKFELKGEPAEDHSWEMLRLRLEGKEPRRSHGYEEVAVPFRLGEHEKLNDGVVGYWVEDEEGGFRQDLFYAPQPASPLDPRIVTSSSLADDTPESRAFVLQRAPSAPPLFLTILMDPRGSAHLTSGMLPVEQIQLAENHNAAALKKISVTFLTAPLLMTGDRAEIFLPGEPGYTWSFLENTPQGWKETPSADITQPELQAAFRGDLRIVEGWPRLQPKPDLPPDS
jgi:hypothetical protein